MTDKTTRTELQSAERRNFLKLATTGSFTAAVVAGGRGHAVVVRGGSAKPPLKNASVRLQQSMS